MKKTDKEIIKFIQSYVIEDKTLSSAKINEKLQEKGFAIAERTIRKIVAAQKSEIRKKEKDKEMSLMLENEQLKARTKSLTKEISDLKNYSSKQLNIINKLRYIVPKIQLVDFCKKQEIPKPKTNRGVSEACLLLSDSHIGETVIYEQMEGYNEYDFNIFCSRLYLLIRETIHTTLLMSSMSKLDTLNVFMLGDMVSGEIHEELMKTNELMSLQSCAMGALVFAQAIIKLLTVYKKIKIFCVVGNHGRTTKKKESKFGHINNYDWILYQLLRSYLLNYEKKNLVDFIIPDSLEAIACILNYRILYGHGDAIRMFYRTPFYGIENDSAKQQRMRRLNHGFDFRVMGHFHEQSNLKNEVLMNGSMIGPNEYGKNKLHEVAPPVQKFFEINEKYGIGWEFNFNLTNADEHDFKINIDDTLNIL